MVIWYMLLIIILYVICSITVVLVMIILFMEFDYFMLIFFEYYTLMFFYLVGNMGSSYERGTANIFILLFSYTLGFAVVMSNSLVLIGLLLLLLSLAKLPIYSLHIWLPKVHVEASMLSSIVLASAVLNLGIIYVWNFGSLMMVSVVLVMSAVMMISVADGKAFAAYSSVLHITMCVIVGLIVILLVSYMHIIISPLIFITVYIAYGVNSSRFYLKMGIMIIVLWIVNFGLPFLGSFFSEVYVIQYGTVILWVLVVIYIIVGYVIIKSINSTGSSIFVIPWLVLYLLIM